MRGSARPGRRCAVINLPATRAAWGAALLLAPDAVLRQVGDGPIDPRTRGVTQVLGGRELLQALITSRHRSRASILSGAAADATHAATMLALAIRHPAYRRQARASALIAASFAIAGLASAGKRPECERDERRHLPWPRDPCGQPRTLRTHETSEPRRAKAAPDQVPLNERIPAISYRPHSVGQRRHD